MIVIAVKWRHVMPTHTASDYAWVTRLVGPNRGDFIYHSTIPLFAPLIFTIVFLPFVCLKPAHFVMPIYSHTSEHPATIQCRVARQ